MSDYVINVDTLSSSAYAGGAPGPSFADIARRTGSLAGQSVPSNATDQQVLDILTSTSTSTFNRAQNAVPFSTWTSLSSATGMLAGDKASVLSSDTGTHTDPVAGGTVDNGGLYVYSTSPAGWRRTADLDSQTSADAATVAASVAIISRNLGPGAMTGTTFPTSLLNTYIFPAFDCDGLLDAIDLFSMASGVGNIQFKLLTINGDGTANLASELSSTVWSSTGVQTKNFGGVAFTKGQRLAVRRSATNSGTFSYMASAANGIVDTATGDLTGTNNTVSAGNVMPWYAIRFRETVKPADNRSRLDRVMEATGLDNVRDLVTRSQLRTGCLPSTPYTSSATALCPATVTKFAGKLKTLRINVTATGLFTFTVFSPDDAAGTTWTVERVINKQITSTGLQTLTAGTDFDPGFIGKGWRIGVTPSGGAGYGLTTGVTNAVYYSAATPLRLGQSVTMTRLTGVLLSFDIGVESVATSLADVIETRGERQRGFTPITSECFPGTSTPSNWTLNSWTVSAGISSPAAGSWTAAALYTGGVPNATRRTEVMSFTIATASTAIKTGIVYPGAYSGGILVNCATNSLEIYSTDVSTGATFTMRASTPITFATAPGTTAGRKYTLQVKRKRNRIVVTLWDRKTQENVSIDLNTNAFNAVLLKSHNGVGPVLQTGSGSSGDVLVTQFDSNVDVSSSPLAIFLGDSIAEGVYVTDEDPRAWPEMMDDARGRGDMLVCATGGQNTTNLTGYIDAVLAPFTPKYVVIQIGTNDTSDSTWQTNVGTIISKIVAKGAKPILCTLAPRSDRSTIITRNGIIRNRTFGNYPYIDVSEAVSNDDINQISGMFLADGVHPATAGNLAIAARALVDQPALRGDIIQ